MNFGRVEACLLARRGSLYFLCSEVESAWRKVRRDPANPEALRELGHALKSTGQSDRRLFVAQALSVLGKANSEDARSVAEHTGIALPRPHSGLSQSAWYDQLLHPDQEVTTGNIFGVIAPAVLLGKVAALGRDGTLYKAKPDQRQDPSQTTLTAVRALAWSAAILGVGIPVVIVDPEMRRFICPHTGPASHDIGSQFGPLGARAARACIFGGAALGYVPRRALRSNTVSVSARS